MVIPTPTLSMLHRTTANRGGKVKNLDFTIEGGCARLAS
jgi:hypothetical protein